MSTYDDVLAFLKETKEEYPDIITISAGLNLNPAYVGNIVDNLLESGKIVAHSGRRFMAGSYYSVAEKTGE